MNENEKTTDNENIIPEDEDNNIVPENEDEKVVVENEDAPEDEGEDEENSEDDAPEDEGEDEETEKKRESDRFEGVLGNAVEKIDGDPEKLLELKVPSKIKDEIIKRYPEDFGNAKSLSEYKLKVYKEDELSRNTGVTELQAERRAKRNLAFEKVSEELESKNRDKMIEGELKRMKVEINPLELKKITSSIAELTDIGVPLARATSLAILEQTAKPTFKKKGDMKVARGGKYSVSKDTISENELEDLSQSEYNIAREKIEKGELAYTGN